MGRGIPSILAALFVAGLLAAGVIAAPEQDSASDRGAKGSGPLAVMRDRPTDLSPEFDRFQQPQVDPTPPLEPVDAMQPDPPVRPSRALGQPWAGRLANGVQFPPEGLAFYTSDSALHTTPSRGWRRWGTTWNVERTLAVLNDFHKAHPDAPRPGVGDLSRPTGGPFGRRYGGLGHASHQNGIDVDIYYPRRDALEQAPTKPRQVDRALSQELVDRFVAAGATKVFTGPSLGLRGPRGVVSPLVHHDNHMHVRWPAR